MAKRIIRAREIQKERFADLDEYERVKDRIEAEEIGVIPLKGKSQEVFVYQLNKIKTLEENR